MGWFNAHEHSWRVDSFHFTPPTHSVERMRGVSLDVFERVIRADKEGVTNVYLRCTTCGALETKTVYGKYEPKE